MFNKCLAFLFSALLAKYVRFYTPVNLEIDSLKCAKAKPHYSPRSGLRRIDEIDCANALGISVEQVQMLKDSVDYYRPGV